jgi:alpha-amylase
MKFNSLFLPVAAWAGTALALSAADWKTQSIYQVLTDRFARTDGSTTASCNLASYCGGTWRGLINKLDYIQGMGFTAVWISPIVKNIEGGTPYGDAYHGYWATDIWSLNSHFGTEQDLQDLSRALHDRGMYLMVDIVTNHMGYNGCGDCVNYSTLSPFNSASFYHPFCLINDYDDEDQVRNCWSGDNTVSLPDLRTEDSYVRRVWNDWIKQIVAKYSIDGLRIDSAKHVEKDFWRPFEQDSSVFNLGEVLDGDPNRIFPWLEDMGGVMNYPMFFWITRAFESPASTLAELINGVNWMKDSIDTSTLGMFIENHDQKRFAALTGDMALAKNVSTCIMTIARFMN